MSDAENKRLIHSFQKNSSEVVKVYLQTWGAGDYVDIRVWTALKPGDSAGEQPSRKGLTLRVDLLSELRKGIDLALSAAEVEEAPMSEDEAASDEEKDDDKVPF